PPPPPPTVRGCPARATPPPQDGKGLGGGGFALAPPLRPLPGRAGRRAGPHLPDPLAAAAGHLELVQPDRLRLALPLPHYPGQAGSGPGHPLRQEAQDPAQRPQRRRSLALVRGRPTRPRTDALAHGLRLRPTQPGTAAPPGR